MIHDSKAPTLVRRLTLPMVIAAVFVLGYLGAMLFLFLFPQLGVFEPKYLLPLLNSIFAGAVPLVIAAVQLRIYLTGGQKSILLMGCGMGVFGSSAILSGWLIVGSEGPNINVTIYNVGAMLSAFLNAVATWLVVRQSSSDESGPLKRANVIGVILVIFLLQICLTLAAVKGLTPIFFDQATGPTVLRQWVLSLAIVLNISTSGFLFRHFCRERQPFFYWYSLSMLMLALGLIAAYFQPSVGSPMGWLNRCGHYAAGVYALSGVWAVYRFAQKKGVPLLSGMIEIFQHSQSSFDFLLKTVAEPIIATDRNFIILEWNLAAERNFGHTKTEALGQSLLDLISMPASIATLKSNTDQIINTSEEELHLGGVIEILGKSKTSDNLLLEVTLSRAWIKERLILLFVFRDSSRRKAADEFQQKQIEQFDFMRKVIESLQLGVMVLDRDRKVVLFNRLVSPILGYPPELLAKADLNFSELIQFRCDRGDYPGQAYESVLATILNLMVTNESVQFEHRQKSGKVVSVIGQHIGDEWLMLTYTDITESKTWALARDKSQLQADAANAAKSEFLANMSHELRTPLNAVIGLSVLLAQSPLNRRQIDYAEKIQLSANTLRVLIDDILDLSKIEANELHLELTPFSLNVMMSNVASVLGVGVGKKQIEPVLNIQTHVPDKLRGDVLRLQQILLNLVSNAVKFTEKGEIVLSVRSVPQADASNSTHATFEFEVRDTGMGMTQESQSLIFNEFTQAHESISRLYGGTGLGLAISSRLTKLMDGKLEVHSVLGQGTEFRLTLPILLDTEVAAVAHDVGARAHCDLTILIVDDHPQVRDVLSRSCHQFGWQTHAVDSGAAGLLALTGPDAKYDLVLLDWHMPEMDGLAMLQKVYQCTDFDVPPVILMVAQAEIEQAVIASALFNVDGIIAKPLTSDALLRVVLKSLANDVEQFASPPIASPKVLSGMHLLVVDDNELNQEVMEQILKSAGAQVTLAGNGQLAIDALQASPARFDAVLMDIQMPVMDGYTATRVIRETMGLVDLPILALTAYARPQDRETAKMAGMSGHVAKPLDVQNLLNTLVKLVHERENALPITTTSIQSIDTDFILPGLNLANSFKAFGGDQLGYSRLLHKFVNQQKNRIPEARRLFDNGDREGAIALIHSLSGVSGLLQLNRFSWLARTTESSMLDGKTGNLPVLFEQLEFAMNTVISALDNFDSTAH